MERAGKRPIPVLAFLIGVLPAFLIGCQSGFWNRVGMPVSPENRILLKQGGPEEGAFYTRDLLLVYHYVRDGDSLQMSGTVELRGSTQNFGWLHRLFVRAYFYGPDGRVLDSEPLLVRGRGRSEDTWNFSETLTLPPRTEGMAIGYSGHVRGVGIDAPSWDFWETPFSE